MVAEAAGLPAKSQWFASLLEGRFLRFLSEISGFYYPGACLQEQYKISSKTF